MKCFVTIVNGVLTILENHFIWDVWQGTEDDSKHGLEVKIKSNLKAQGSYTISIIYEFFFLSEFCFTDTEDSECWGREWIISIPLHFFHPLTNININLFWNFASKDIH